MGRVSFFIILCIWAPLIGSPKRRLTMRPCLNVPRVWYLPSAYTCEFSFWYNLTVQRATVYIIAHLYILIKAMSLFLVRPMVPQASGNKNTASLHVVILFLKIGIWGQRHHLSSDSPNILLMVREIKILCIFWSWSSLSTKYGKLGFILLPRTIWFHVLKTVMYCYGVRYPPPMLWCSYSSPS